MAAPTDWERKLEDALVRVQGAIARAQARHEAELRAQGQQPRSPFDFDWLAAREVVRMRRRRARHRWRLERKQWKKQFRRARLERASRFKGYLFAALALLFLVQMTVDPQVLWWMVFLALGFGQASLRNFVHVRQREELEAQERAALPSPESAEAPPPREAAEKAARAGDGSIDQRLRRIDGLCDKLLGEIKNGRPVLQTVVQNPEQTIKALRATCHELARREQALRALVTREDEQRLEAERDGLAMRIGQEQDEVVRSRLGSALAALDEQVRRRRDLAVDAARLEAESTRLLYTLESLYTQVLRVRSADAASSEVVGAGLRQSLEQLGLEIDSVAEALEQVGRDDLSRAGVTAVSPLGSEEPARSPSERERS